MLSLRCALRALLVRTSVNQNYSLRYASGFIIRGLTVATPISACTRNTLLLPYYTRNFINLIAETFSMRNVSFYGYISKQKRSVPKYKIRNLMLMLNVFFFASI